MLMSDTPLTIAYNCLITLYSSSLFSSYTQFNDFIMTAPLVSRYTPPPLIDDQPQKSSSRTALVIHRTPPPLTDDQPQKSSSRTSRGQPPHTVADNRRPDAEIRQPNSTRQPPHTAAANRRPSAAIQKQYITRQPPHTAAANRLPAAEIHQPHIKSTKWSTHSSPTMRH